MQPLAYRAVLAHLPLRWLSAAVVIAAAPASADRPAERPDRLPRMGATETASAPSAARTPPPVSVSAAPKPDLGEMTHFFLSAEERASSAGRRVLGTARQMMQAKTLVIGSCWDYANAVFTRAGHPLKRGKRRTVFKGSRSKRRFASVDLIEPGDWLYYVNHSYSDVPHSAIFVGWLDRAKKRALMITYRGAKRRVPGVLDDYDLRSVYRIIRPSGS